MGARARPALLRVDAVRQAFAPTPEELRWARETVATARERQGQGSAADTLFRRHLRRPRHRARGRPAPRRPKIVGMTSAATPHVAHAVDTVGLRPAPSRRRVIDLAEPLHPGHPVVTDHPGYKHALLRRHGDAVPRGRLVGRQRPARARHAHRRPPSTPWPASATRAVFAAWMPPGAADRGSSPPRRGDDRRRHRAGRPARCAARPRRGRARAGLSDRRRRSRSGSPAAPRRPRRHRAQAQRLS